MPIETMWFWSIDLMKALMFSIQLCGDGRESQVAR